MGIRSGNVGIASHLACIAGDTKRYVIMDTFGRQLKIYLICTRNNFMILGHLSEVSNRLSHIYNKLCEMHMEIHLRKTYPPID